VRDLSDGVFAIAVTLLVLNIAVPDLGRSRHRRKGSVVVHVIPRVVTFAVSLFLAGMYWMIHHRTFQHIWPLDEEQEWLIRKAWLAATGGDSGSLYTGDLDVDEEDE
jgi:uncharacterized membrane protein